jgi:hypothetical protein
VLNDHPAFGVTYDNVGRQPALNSEMWWRVSIVDAELLVRSLKDTSLAGSAFGLTMECDQHSSLKGSEVIWPSSKQESYSNAYVENPTDPIITDEVLNGRVAVVAQGCIFYETFGDVHHSTFCFWFRQVPPAMITTTTAAVICPIGNDAT